jgi:hypothetical protein
VSSTWGNFYSVRLTFRSAAGKAVCPLLRQPIDDPSDTTVQFAADQVMSGRVELLPRCPSLPRLLGQGPVEVDWVYTPGGRKVEGEALHGRIVVPSKR